MSSRRMSGLLLMPLAGVLLSVTAYATASAQEDSRVYDANCALCHQKAGVGVTGQFPRLAGRVAEIAATEAGRRYLIEVALFGMAGKVEVDGAAIIGVMPPLASLSDEDLATTLNYLVALNAAPKAKTRATPSIQPADVAKVRSGPTLSPGQVHSNRAPAIAPLQSRRRSGSHH